MMVAISTVLIYTGHKTQAVLGPYSENIAKRVEMFKALNDYRKELGRDPWEVSQASGEELFKKLHQLNSRATLLVIPAGQSSHLDQVFSATEIFFLKEKFLKNGGRIYVNCGSAYWTSRKRVYQDVCLKQPEKPKVHKKMSNFPIFEGKAVGPLCPFPAVKYKVGFFSDAVEITDGWEVCTIFLSGGGSFLLPKESNQQLRVLLRYPKSELKRLNKPDHLENAAILASVGEGAALMSMFHPYYGPQDIDTERYEKAFSDSGSDWKAIHNKLTPTDIRMRFVLRTMLIPLEDMDFSEKFQRDLHDSLC